MPRVLFVRIICYFAVIFFFTGSQSSFAGYDYIDITNPFLRKIPVAVSYFKTFSGSQEERQVALKTFDLLSATLEFTGYFKMLDRAAFLEDPHQSGITASNIKFHNWTSIGAELLITGIILKTADRLEMELRLYDTFKCKLIVGKRYKSKPGDQRRIVRRFCSEIIYHLTGNRGIFNSRIAFISNASGHKEIYICDFDGYNPKRFTFNNNITLSPAWSSDGRWLAFTSYLKGRPDLYIKNVTQKRGAIVAKKGINTTPAWVPGKFELAATFSFSGDQEIYMLTGKGKITKRLTVNKGIDSSPSFSPDGRKMAFVSKRSGTPQIYIKNFKSGNVNRLTFNGQYNTEPNWSPRGDKIAYSSMSNGEINIFVIGIDGRNLMQLTDSSGDNESPSWSPDGSLILFSSTRAREGHAVIYIMTAYGTDQRRLLSMPGAQTEPAWSTNIN
ncbi:MAG: Tol-Pal system beta propeller repeat protein TolB [Desulfosarcina sp.]|nr:Tol-Pal system beta propeller repeat protein TolB [Desulfobacterales bacterium]